jgi:hypothetical protein
MLLTSKKNSIIFPLNLTKLSWIIISAGICFRGYLYLLNRSIWLDEAFIANTIVNASFLELFKQPLEYGHIVPPLFLVLVKIPVVLFGNTDIILRLFPFICSIASLLLFYKVSNLYLSRQASLIALAFFSIAESPIYYAVEIKQYGTDLFVTLFLLWVTFYIKQSPLKISKAILLAVSGSIVIWLSHPSIFLLTTIGLYLSFFYIQQKEKKSLFYLIGIYSLWLCSFLGMYFFVMGGGLQKSMPTSQWFFYFWELEKAFIPYDFLFGWEWLSSHYFELFKFPVGFSSLNKVAGFLFLIGCFYLLKMKQIKILFLCTIPLILVLIANYFHQYPFPVNHLIASRVLLFLIPCLYFVVAEGVVQLLKNNYRIANIQLQPLITGIVTVFLIIRIAMPTIQHFNSSSFIVQDVKGVFNILKMQRQPYDKVYLYHWVDPMFRYYAPQYGFNYEECHLINAIPVSPHLKEVDYFRRNAIVTSVSSTHCILGVSELSHLSQIDLDMLRGQGRVWFVFAHSTDTEGFLRYLDQIGKRLYDFSTVGASIYLYEL